MSRPGTCDSPFSSALRVRLWVHDIGPIDPISVVDDERDRRTQGVAVSNSGEKVDLIALDLHSGTAPITTHAALQFAVDEGHVNRHLRRKTLDNRNKTLTVRLSRGEKSEHRPFPSDPLRYKKTLRPMPDFAKILFVSELKAWTDVSIGLALWAIAVVPGSIVMGGE